jgi:Mn2+/Fe2+ NRAMP family transporter
MIGAGLLAVPILSGSAAYAIAEAFGWRYGLGHDWHTAKEFYAVITIATALGVAMNFTGINPIDALFWTAVINGAVAPPLLVLVMLAARNPKVMGEQRIGTVLTLLGWIATVGMWIALGALVFTTVVR